jgi:hypothetical protein
MVRHQKFHQSAANSHDSLGIRLDGHPLLRLTNAGSGVNSLAYVHYAHAAHPHGILILLVAQCGDGNALDTGSVKNSSALRDGHGRAVDGQLHVFYRNRFACHSIGTHHFVRTDRSIPLPDSGVG